MSSVISDWKQLTDVTMQLQDLDPTYYYFHNLREVRGEAWVRRCLMHMLMFYHVGEAAAAAEYNSLQFWDAVEYNYYDTKRGSERRHFRGEAGLKIVYQLREQLGANIEGFWDDIYRPNYRDLANRVGQWPGFGPYFAWKAADYCDRVLGKPVNYNGCIDLMPQGPKDYAATLWPQHSFDEVILNIALYINEKEYMAPGIPDRFCWISEAETLLCSFRGFFITGSHKIGGDLLEKHKQMKDFPDYLQFLPPMQDTSQYVKGTYEIPFRTLD